MRAKLSVIIVAYHSNEVLLPCLRSIEQFNPYGKALEIVVVDNFPSDHLDDLLYKHNWNFSLQYEKNPENGGFGQGNNVGAHVASAPYLFFLNPDTVIVEDVFQPTYDLLNNSDKEVVGYSLVDVDGKPNNSYSYLPEYLFLFPVLHLLERLGGTWFINNVACINRITWPWGAAFAVSKVAFENAGLFDEHIFLCNEEPDLMHRLKGHRLTILKNKIIHLEGHGREVPVERYLAYLQSLDYYLRKHKDKRPNLFWAWLGLKLKIKKVLRGRADNLDIAYSQFIKERDFKQKH